MATNNRSPFPQGFEPVRIAGGSSSHGRRPSYGDHHRRSSSGAENFMSTIGEDDEYDFADTKPFARPGTASYDTEATQMGDSPSIIRRLSTRLGIGGSMHRSRPHQRKDYSSVQETQDEFIDVDLSSLAGLGIELREVTNSNNAGFVTPHEQDTVYRGASEPTGKPNFNDFRKRIGNGMVIAAQLENRQVEPPNPSLVNQHKDSVRRMETVRQVGQNLAQQKGQMVSYNEGIDLSVLEGSGLRHRQSTTFEEMSMNRASTMPDTKSYFFPPDPEIPDWKPFSMRPPWIIMLAVIAFGIAGFQEYLCQISLRMQAKSPRTALLAFKTIDDVSVGQFFIWKYLPTMITISYAVLYSIMDFDIRRLEPYYQLSKPHGARASASLNLDHLTMFQYFVPFNAFRLGQWAVFASTFANIIAATIAPALQNPSVQFEANPACEKEEGKQGPPLCPDPAENPFWVIIDPGWSRAMTAAYVVVGFVLIFLLVRLRRKSGLLSDPKGIAGIASMATKSHILQDFKNLDLGTRGDIHKRLAHRTYVLYKSSIWQGEFNLQPEKNEFQDSERRLASPHPLMLRLQAGIPFIIIMILCLGCVPVISVTKARVIPNAAPWLPILVATVLKLVWTTFEADVRLIEPFYQLSKGRARPQNSLTLDYQSTVYGWMPIRAMLNGHFLVALVGLSTVLLDILSVTIGSFSVDSAVFLNRGKREKGGGGSPQSPEASSQDESYISFWASLSISIACLLFAILVACLVYARRRHPFLPREPSTIASVLSFIYASNMLNDFVDTELLDSKTMEKKLKNLNKTYALGWFRGRDGKIHCAIDEEPVVSKYIHGKPYSAAVSGPLAEHETFYYTNNL